MKIVFVILHYITLQETIDCVRCIQEKVDSKRYQIVIVDNASPNQSGVQLQKKYANQERVTVLCNKENLGFARGNNIGFQYAKERWNPEYIVLLNNDVFLLEQALVAKLDQEYQESEFAVLGPLIMMRNGRCDVNPQETEFHSVEEIERRRKRYEKELRRYQLGYGPLYYRLAAAKGALVGKAKVHRKDYLTRLENVKLHGCFLVFSQTYIQQFDGLDPSTFLYWEEELLYLHMQMRGLKTVYRPDILVYHMEDAATDAYFPAARDKKIFVLTHYLDSLEQLKILYQTYEEQKRKEGFDA